MKNPNELQLKELEKIQASNPDNLLQTKEIVDFARDPKTALHDWFTWDNAAAGEQWRYEEARRLIRISVVILVVPKQAPIKMGIRVMKPKEIPKYVSLQDDRRKPGGGYRKLADVMQNDNLRAQLLNQALEDFKAWKAKYGRLKELAEIFQAADNVEKTFRKRKSA